ncbi:MAG: hypothetical protein MNPFHGCM_03175 [Gemmatimonadaceae bacterium]|nr:hypothetical protein [Gemmatimonadaceae bacterium]
MTDSPARPPVDPIDLLARDDKWFLGCGDGILFAPAFPVWLDYPGFWDEGTIYQYAFSPLFTVALLDEGGRELRLRPVSRRWTPSELTVDYVAEDLSATETRSVHIGGVFVSEWRISVSRVRRLHLIGWTAQDAQHIDHDSVRWERTLGFRRTLRDRRDVPFDVRAELACTGGREAASWSAILSERSALHPHWKLTPFVEQWRMESLPRRIALTGTSRDGLMYAALHQELPPQAESSAGFALRLTAADDAMRHGRGRHAGPRRTTWTPPSTAAARAVAPTPGSLGAASRRRWQDLFALVPRFRCSDPYFERYYWYRWYGLWLNAIDGGVGNYDSPTMCEGIGFFHQPITYSGQCHVRELRWLTDPAWARGVLRSFFRHQRADGSLHGRIYVNHLTGTDFYHANWGEALLALDAVWPDDAFVSELYPALARHSDWLARTRDAGETGMIDVVDQYETGQEYMSRYQAVDPSADTYGWENRIRLKGIDVTVYAYALARALARIARRAGAVDDVARWSTRADAIATSVRNTMWNDATGMFSDVNPVTGGRTDVSAAVCFYPYFTDLADERHLYGLERNLFDPARFWTTYPVPSSALDDPLFNAEAEWKGKRHVCPWNGRVWPMTNSHVVEALGRWATPERPKLRQGLVRLLRQFVRMMYHDGNLDRPNCFEHYNPFTGQASVYRGIDDYQHSWIADLIIQYVAGIRPHDNGVTIDPFPFGLDEVELTGAHVRGRMVAVGIAGDRYTVVIDGERHDREVGEVLDLRW